MADPYYGEIRAFAFNYAPMNWAFCDGQSVPVAQNQALYSVIANLYGGNNQTFRLPDLRGRTVMGSGAGPGLTPRSVSNAVGTRSEALTAAQTPNHSHPVVAEGANGTSLDPVNAYWAKGVKGTPPRVSAVNTYAVVAPNAGMAANALTAFAGGSGAHSNMQPYLTLNFCICLNGEIYPQRP